MVMEGDGPSIFSTLPGQFEEHHLPTTPVNQPSYNRPVWKDGKRTTKKTSNVLFLMNIPSGEYANLLKEIQMNPTVTMLYTHW